MNFSIKNGVLEIEGKVISSFIAEKAIEKNGVLVVLHKYTDEGTFPDNDNVFGFNSDGKIIWRLKNPDPEFYSCVTGLFEKEGRIALWFYSDRSGKFIDEQTGKVLESFFQPS